LRQAKDADRPGPNGKRYGWSVRFSLHVIDDPSGGQTGANPLCVESGTWQARISPSSEGKLAARLAYGGAGRGKLEKAKADL